MADPDPQERLLDRMSRLAVEHERHAEAATTHLGFALDPASEIEADDDPDDEHYTVEDRRHAASVEATLAQAAATALVACTQLYVSREPGRERTPRPAAEPQRQPQQPQQHQQRQPDQREP